MMSSITSYKLLTGNVSKTLTQLGSQPELKREIEYYKANISKIKTIDDFLGNQRIYNFAMTAFGMKDLIYAKGMMRKVLTEGVDSPKSFAMTLTDQRFRDFATTFDFKTYGSAATAFDRTQQGTVDKFMQNALEEKAGQSNEAVRMAIYFDRKASSLTTPYSILADKAIYAVVRTALGLPDSLAGSDIEKQAKLIGSRVNIEDFKDPAKRSAFITRYLGMSDAKTSAASTSPTAALYSGVSGRIDMSTLLSIQTLKRFGS
ncbi:MAG: DUF1217 domain-containing protein [Rhizobiales bacterium]|nr:DUF1217 domain-containing protein [Hyphomicrobiales bacterium]